MNDSSLNFMKKYTTIELLHLGEIYVDSNLDYKLIHRNEFKSFSIFSELQ